MYIYKAIIWLSLLTLIGEGVVLSGFNFVSQNGARGEVLGESTSQVLEELASARFPASYYSQVDGIGESPDQAQPEPQEQNVATVDSGKPTFSSATVSDPRDALVQILNTPSQYEISFPRTSAQEPAGDAGVDTLIKKNERLYRERVIKELHDIKDRYESIESGS